MKKSMTWATMIPFLSFLIAAVLCSAAVAFGSESTTIPGNALQGDAVVCKNVPPIEFSIPESEADKMYLGLTGNGKFRIGEIKSQVLIVQIFSFYCPHCQRTASQVNDLYEEIRRRSDLNGKIKMIGIGAKNSAYEVESYRERYRVPFPLFPDRNLEITEKLCVKGTPTFIGFKVDGKGSQEQFYFGEGGFQETPKFLSDIVRLSGIK